MRITNKLLALHARLRRENFTMLAIVMPLANRNELATECEQPHIAGFLGVPIIVSEKLQEPTFAVAV